MQQVMCSLGFFVPPPRLVGTVSEVSSGCTGQGTRPGTNSKLARKEEKLPRSQRCHVASLLARKWTVRRVTKVLNV